MSQYNYKTTAPIIRNCSCVFSTLKRKFTSSITDSLKKIMVNINWLHQGDFKQTTLSETWCNNFSPLQPQEFTTHNIIGNMMQQLRSSATPRIHYTHALSLGKHSSIFLQWLLYISLVYIKQTALFFYHRFSYMLQHGEWRYSRHHVCVQMNACMCICACAHALTVNVLYILCMYRTFRTGCNMKFQYLSSIGHPTLK